MASVDPCSCPTSEEKTAFLSQKGPCFNCRQQRGILCGECDDYAFSMHRAVPRKFSWGVLCLRVPTKMGVADARWVWLIKFAVLYAMKLWSMIVIPNYRE